MRRTAITGPALMMLAFSVAGVARPARAGIAYTLTVLGDFGGGTGAGLAVNDSGQVTGYAATTSGAQYAFLSGPGGSPLKDLGTLGGTQQSVGYGVNDSGQVTGYASTTSEPQHAFLSGPDGGPLKDLGTFGGPSSAGNAVNAFGQVAGGADTANAQHAFLSGPNGGPLKDLGTLGGTLSTANGVNASGQVAGSSLTTGGVYHAFLSRPDGGPLKDLGTLGGTTSMAYAVNASGQVAGVSDIAGGGQHAFLSGPNGGPLKDLGTLPGTADSSASAVNASGQVVGSCDPFGGFIAFLYSGGQMFDLNSLIAAGSGFTLELATGISDTGYISGIGMAADGSVHGFLLTPATVPEPAGLVLLGIGAVGLLGYTVRRRVRSRV